MGEDPESQNGSNAQGKGYNVKSVALVPAGSVSAGTPAQNQYEFVVTKTVGGMEVSQPDIIWKAGAAGLVEEIVVKVNGTDTRIAKTVTTISGLVTAAKVTEAGKYVYAKLGTADADYIATSDTSKTIAKGDSFEFGFYKVTSDVRALTNSGSFGGASKVISPVSTNGANVKFVKAEEQTFDFVLELTAKTTGIVEVNVGTVGTVTAGNTMASGMKEKDKHNVTVTLTASDIKGAAGDIVLTLALADRTDKTIEINGVKKTFAEDATWADVYAEYGIAHGTEGTWAKQTVGATESWADLSDDDSIVDGASYELGYYQLKVTTDFVATNMAQTSAKWTLDGVAVATPTTAFYAKEGQKLVCTVTTNATGFTAAAGQKLTGSTGAVAAIEKAYASGTAPTGEGTVELTYTASDEYKDGVVSFTWTTGKADNAAITIVPAKS